MGFMNVHEVRFRVQGDGFNVHGARFGAQDLRIARALRTNLEPNP